MVPTSSYEIPRVSHYSGSYLAISVSSYRTLTFFGLLSQTILITSIVVLVVLYPYCISTLGLGSSYFARHYSRNRVFFLFLQVLRCFSSLRSLPIHYFTHVWITCSFRKLSSLIRISMVQWIFAPTHSFSQLITSFFGSWCLGIHPTLLVA